MSLKSLMTGRALTTVRLACVLLLASGWLAAQQPADIILHNAKVLTVDKNFSIAQAIAVTGNTITAVGQEADVMKLAGPNTQVIDVKGRTIIPGLMDTHLHYTGLDYGGDLPEPQRAVFKVDWQGVRS